MSGDAHCRHTHRARIVCFVTFYIGLALFSAVQPASKERSYLLWISFLSHCIVLICISMLQVLLDAWIWWCTVAYPVIAPLLLGLWLYTLLALVWGVIGNLKLITHMTGWDFGQIDRSGWQVWLPSWQVVWSHVNNRMMYVCSLFTPTWPSPWLNRWAPCCHLLNYCIDCHPVVHIQWAKKLVHVVALFLGRQVAPQGTNLNPLSIRWPSILPLYGPNSINSSFVPQFIETLQSSRLNEPVCLLTTTLPKSHDIMWLNLKYYVTWPSTIYWTPQCNYTLNKCAQRSTVKYPYFAPKR